MSQTTSNTKTLAWAIWIVASVFYAYQYILRVMPSIMLNDLIEQFGITTATFGQFSGIYYIGYSLVHLPIGIMLDRYGPKKVMTGCILLTVAGLMPLLFSDYWIYPIAGRFLIGAGSSAAILGVFKIIRMTFSEDRFSRMLSFSVTIGLLGAIYGGGPVSYMRDALGYQAVIQILAVAGVFLAGITYWIVPEVKNSSDKTVFSDIKDVLTNAKVICCCIFAGLMVGPLEGFADVWGATFLKQSYGYDGTLAASMPSLIFIGMCFGAPLLSLIADKMGGPLTAIVGAGFVMCICFASMLAWKLPSALVTIDFMIIGVCSAYQILAIFKASTYVREQLAGLTTAMANMIIMVFGYGFHVVIGTVVESMGGPTSSHALTYGTIVIPVTLFLGAGGFLYLFLEDRSKQEERFDTLANSTALEEST